MASSAGCLQTGYQGRQLTAELLDLGVSEIASKIQAGTDAHALRAIALTHGMKSLYQQTTELIRAGTTSPAEVVRVFGLSNSQAVLGPIEAR